MPRRLRIGNTGNNWLSRSAGAVRAFAFNSAAEMGVESGTAAVGYYPGHQHIPTYDASVNTGSTSGSIRFDIDGFNQSDASGAWYANFSDDSSVQFDEGEEFYIQWRQLFNQAMCNTVLYLPGGLEQAGIKQMDVTAGDTLVLYEGEYTSQSGVPGTRGVGTSHITKCVFQTYYQHRFPQIYGYDTHPSGPFDHTRYDELTQPEDYYFQNQRNPPGNWLSLSLGDPSDAARLSAGNCLGWFPDEWMTFQLSIKLGPRGTFGGADVWTNSEFKFWGAREGQPQELLHHYHPSTPGYFPQRCGPHADVFKMGKMNFFPYMTDMAGDQDHARMTTWVTEIIVSTSFIADPVD